MNVLAVNGSPRKHWNTATLLKYTLDGAASKGAQTELIHLYDLNYKGCTSCFACKYKEGSSYGKCAMRDDLSSVLDKITRADALIIGTPIYFGMPTGETRSFLERLLFQYLIYDARYSSLFQRKMQTGMIYTMNVSDAYIDKAGYLQMIQGIENTMKRIFGASETLVATDTKQFEDYSKYDTSAFDAAQKLKRHEDVFPSDCKKAFQMGADFAERLG